MKTLTLLTTLWILSLSASAQDTFYFTSFATQAQRADWEEFRFGGEQSPFYKWRMVTISGRTDMASLVHNYPVAATDTTDDWFVSPAFDFEKGGRVDSIWAKYSGFGTPMTIDTIALYLLIGDKDPALASELILLNLFTDSTYMNDNTWRRIDSIDIPARTGIAHLAFRYTTKSNWLDVQFDDLHVTMFRDDPVEPTNVNSFERENSNLTLYPNPTSGEFTIQFGSEQEKVELKVLDATGKLVDKQTFQNTTQIDYSLDIPEGLYLIEVSDEQSQKSLIRLIKQL